MLVPAALPWLGPEREGRKGPPLRRLRVRHEKRKFAKRTWNVPWNQQINVLVRPTNPVAEARTHRKKRDVCATRGWFGLRERTQPLGTKPECVLESIVSQSARLSRIGCVGEYLYGAPVLVPAALPWFGPEREGRKGPPLRRCG